LIDIIDKFSIRRHRHDAINDILVSDIALA
jgi:hypothetical protein